MSEVLTVVLPEDLARQAKALALATNRRLEDAVLDWVRQAITEPPIETLDDEALMEFCNLALDEARQEELSGLLEQAKAGKLGSRENARLDELMAEYRRGLKLKARALKEATSRGLIPPLSDNAA
jgi:hypothetical protein